MSPELRAAVTEAKERLSELAIARHAAMRAADRVSLLAEREGLALIRTDESGGYLVKIEATIMEPVE